MRLFLAFRAFFRALASRETAGRIEQALDAAAAPLPSLPAGQAATAAPVKASAKPARSEALSLLAALQREGRLVDFLQESLTGFSDAQIGGVAREIHRDCGKAIDRMFGIRPAVAQTEGETVELPSGFDAGRYKLVGKVGASVPFRGRLLHPGWEASRCEIPSWTGEESSRSVIAPAEVEVG